VIVNFNFVNEWYWL